MSDTEYRTTAELDGEEIEITVIGERTPYRAQTHLDPPEGGFEVLGFEVGGDWFPYSEAVKRFGVHQVNRMAVDADEDADRADEGDRGDRAYEEWKDRHIDGGEFDLGGGA